MRRILSIVDRVSVLLAVIAGVMLLVLIVDMMYEVVSRRVFSAPTLWAYDIAYMVNGVGFLFAAGYTLRKNAHIRIDFLSTRLARRHQDWINVVAYIFLIFPALLFFVIGAYSEFVEAFKTNELDPASPWKPLLWPLFAGLLIGFTGLFLQAVVECIRHTYSALGLILSPLEQSGDSLTEKNG
ncbi:MAG: TRAP transporter small permease subunit [Pseudomonadota bacterium]|nr:TRAP transporter small permease subunit [Pseudomonadota bacterium]